MDAPRMADGIIGRRAKSFWTIAGAEVCICGVLLGLLIIGLGLIRFAPAVITHIPVAEFATSLIVMLLLLSMGMAGVLFSARSVGQRQPFVAMAITMATVAVGALTTLLTYPGDTVRAAFFPVQLDIAQLIGTGWTAYVPVAALVYVWLRRLESFGPTYSESVVARFALGSRIYAFALIALAILATNATLSPDAVADVDSGRKALGILDILIGSITLATVFSIRRGNIIDRAVAVSTFATVLYGVLAIATAWTPFVSLLGRSLLALGGFYLVVAIFREIVSASNRLPIEQLRLAQTQAGAMRQSERLRAVWNIVRDDRLADVERAQAILDAAARSIRPGTTFFAYLGHVEDSMLVIDQQSDPQTRLDLGLSDERFIPIGGREELADTPHSEIYTGNGTVGVSNIDADAPYLRNARKWAAPWASMIGTTFAINGVRHSLLLLSTRTFTHDPFVDEDRAFVDVLASFLGTLLHQRDQLAKIRFQIEHDQLTALPNRSQLRVAASRALMSDTPFAIAVIDLDRFREVNESFGHLVGDSILIEVAGVLREVRAHGDAVARLGGDTFAVLIASIESSTDIEGAVLSYLDPFALPFPIMDARGQRTIHLTACAGVAIFPQDGTSFEELLAHAESAVQVAKHTSRGSIAYYDATMQRSVERRRILRSDLASAIASDQLSLRYQPTIDLATMSFVGSEALVRWEHPEQGTVQPDDFIPFAEANGLIGSLGLWVMRRAIADISVLGEMPPQYRMYLNLSSQQLGDDDFLHALRSALIEFPAAAGRIAVEVTETVAMQDVERTLRFLGQLGDLGVKIAVDDFGTGYSSLSYLKRFPIDVLKIDKSFVNGLPHDPHDVALVRTLIAIAQQFGFATLAEGIETAGQMTWLRENGCTFGQGFAIARPMTFEAFDMYVKSSRSTREPTPRALPLRS